MIPRPFSLLVACLMLPSSQGFMPRPSKQVGGATPTTGSHKGGCSSSDSRSQYRPSSSSSKAHQPSRLSSTATMTDGPSDVEIASASAMDGSSSPEEALAGSPMNVASTTTPAGGPKEELINLVSGGLLDFSSPMKRASVNELLLRLEALNPTPMPAYSPLLNGAWEFLWTGGISPGILGLQLASRVSQYASGAVEVGETVLTISRAQPRVEVVTSLKVFGRENSIKIRTRLEPASELRLDETYTEASMGSLRVPFPDEQQLFKRPIFVSYLDDDLLVVRDSFGAPDVLVRKDKDFLSNTGVPSATDDDTSPGAG